MKGIAQVLVACRLEYNTLQGDQLVFQSSHTKITCTKHVTSPSTWSFYAFLMIQTVPPWTQLQNAGLGCTSTVYVHMPYLLVALHKVALCQPLQVLPHCRWSRSVSSRRGWGQSAAKARLQLSSDQHWRSVCGTDLGEEQNNMYY